MMWLRLWRAFSPALRTGRSIHQALADDLNRLIFVALLKSVTVESLLCGGDFAVQLVKVGNESLAQGCSAILLSRDVFGLLCLEGRQSPFHRLNCDIRRTVMQRLAMNFLFEPLQVLGSERMRWRELGQPIGSEPISERPIQRSRQHEDQQAVQEPNSKETGRPKPPPSGHYSCPG